MCLESESFALRTRVFDYGGEPLAKLRWLVADKVIPTWPAPGKAGTVDVLRCISGELYDDIADV